MAEAPPADTAIPDDAPYSNPQAFDPPPNTSWGKILALVPEGSRVLDVGCAFGAFSSALRRLRGCRVTGVEVNSAAAAIARRHCDEVIEGDLQALGDRLPGGFDVVVAADVLEHLVEPGEALRLLAGRLRPGGVLLASIPNVTHMSVILALAGGRFPRSAEGLLDVTHLRFFGEADVLDLFHQAGYAARVADRVQLDPRLTEFKSDLGGLPQPVLDFLGRNPNADTYQFIVRAVPEAWAHQGDDQRSAAPAGEAGSAESIRAQLDALHQELRKYHEALTGSQKETSALQKAVGELREGLRTAQISAAVRGDASETAREQRRARSFRDFGPLSPKERAELRTLFVCDRDDAPFRYRCVNAVRQLRASGVAANLARLDSPTLAGEIPSYSVVILFRLGWSPAVERVVAAARESKAAVGFDIDDLLFDPEVEQWMPFVRRAAPETLAAYRRSMGALAETLRAADFCVAATPTIARHARERGKQAIVHPNLLPDEYVELSPLAARLRPRLLRRPRFAYLSGSNTHDGDLASIAGPLAEVLGRAPDAQLFVIGHAAVPPSLRPLGERVVSLPYQDHRVYPWLMSRCNAVLAPLEELNDFTHAKSALKVFEAGAFGVAAIASPSVQYASAIDDGVSGALAQTPAEWADALARLCDRNLALAWGAAARRIALRDFSPAGYEHVLARKLLAVRGRAARAGRPTLAAIGPPFRLREGLALAARSLRLALDPGAAARGGAGAAELAPADPARAAAVSAWVSAATRLGLELRAGGRAIGTLLADREHPVSGWKADQLRSLDGPPGGCRLESLGQDPKLVLEDLPALPRPPRALLLEMRARTASGTAVAQLFWREPGANFSEARSLAFKVIADGEPRRYLLEATGPSGIVPRAAAGLRFDPLDRPGELEITQLALLQDEVPASAGDVRRELAGRFLAGTGIEIGALQNPLPAPAGATVRYVDRLPLAALREQYPELAGAPLVDPSVIAAADDLQPIAAGSQAFVICNHVLEHMRDPLGALQEWLRVLQPGGVLYVSIPSRENPHDRGRPLTTFEHLIDDRRGRGRKGSEIDRAAYFEWTRSVHGGNWPEEQCDRFAADLIAQDYSIHFHVFDRALFERVLSAAAGEGGARLIELVEVPLEEYREFIAILRKGPARPAERGVDVVVPVYNARELTRRCVESVLRHATGDVRVVLVDDASTDPGIAADLREFAAADRRVVALANERNLGFVGTANRALRHAQGRDVLLLNSDTEVFAGFLDRLRDAARFDASTGIVTPFSNSATIYSLPQFGDNPIPPGHTAESMARLVTAASRKLRPEMPTAVGFCMYIRAEVLEKVGFFDEETFGRGFGEEDDLCMRARKAGFKVRLCDDVFVWHKGKASFGAEGLALEGRNGERLRRKHPEYGSEIAHFFRSKPLERLHREIRFHIPRLREGARGAPLFVVHASPFAPFAGGTEHHVRDLLAALALPRAVLGYPEADALVAAEVLDGRVDEARFFRFPLSKPAERFCTADAEIEGIVRRWIALFGIRWAHLQHLMFWPLSLGATLRELGVPYLFTAHDFYSVCPSWNLFDSARGEPCACPDPSGGDPGCVPAHLEQLKVPPLDAGELRRRHRAASLATLRHAAAVVTPSDAVRRRLLAHLGLPPERMRVIEHGYDAARPSSRKEGGPRLRLSVLGEVAYPLKGARLYLELMQATRDLPLEWHVFGRVDRFGYDEQLRALGLGERLRLHGAYERARIVELLAGEGIDLAVLFPACEETFSFTLSESLIAGVPALVPAGRGALPDRVQREGTGIVVGSVAEGAAMLGRLCADRSLLAPFTAAARAHRHRTGAENAQDHRDLYASLGFALSLEAELAPESLRELADRAGLHPPEAPPPAPAQRQLPWMLRQAERVVPGRLRPLSHRVLERIALRPVLVLDPSRPDARVGLKLLGKEGASARYEAESSDPQLVFNVRRLDPARVRELRFRLRRPAAGIAYAQLFWASDARPEFSEERSAMVLLDGAAGEWGEYSFRLDTPDVAAAWRSGRVVHLRIDPIDQPGVIELGPAELR